MHFIDMNHTGVVLTNLVATRMLSIFMICSQFPVSFENFIELYCHQWKVYLGLAVPLLLTILFHTHTITATSAIQQDC